MRKIFIVLSISVMVYACGNQDAGAAKDADSAKATTTAPVTVEPAVKDVTENPDYAAGLELIAKSDCLTCHKVEEKLIGPAYRDVANKYTSDEKTIAMLVDKILKGGGGVWGPIAMTPHPAMSKEDATKMVKYVLLLKNK
ncbi:MAG: c-type cytochrome [Chitinophagaceae bacterium]